MLDAIALTRTYGSPESPIHALAGLSLSVPAGQHLAISGASGSGKTSLLHVLGLLDPDFGGQLTFAGHDVRTLTSSALARLRLTKIGFVFQAFHLLPGLTVLDNVALPAWHLHGDRARARSQAEALLTRFGLGKRLKEDPLRLSGGEQQRTALARALVNDPVLVLADEPTGNLDSRSAGSVLDALRELESNGRTLITVSHDPIVVSAAARAVELRDGEVVSDRSLRAPA